MILKQRKIQIKLVLNYCDSEINFNLQHLYHGFPNVLGYTYGCAYAYEASESQILFLYEKCVVIYTVLQKLPTMIPRLCIRVC